MSAEGKEYPAREGLYNQQRLPTPVSNGPEPLFGEFSQCPSRDGNTQPASQLSNFDCSVDDVEDEAEKGVWGYLTPLGRSGDSRLVLKDRQPQDASTGHWSRPGYLVGRHPECDYTLDGTALKTSNRHFVIFRENRLGRIVAVLEDLSGNGTFVNGRLVGKNNCCELSHRDAVSCVKDATFIFEYPKSILASTRFQISYHVAERLGHGQYGSVHVAIEKQTGVRYAVKHLVKIPSSQSLVNLVQQKREIATLAQLDHPNIMCIKETFDQPDGLFLVLELAEGDLFDLITRCSRLEESHIRALFSQILSATKYLHDRNIIHRDIKPENVLLMNNGATAKLADFGLAKIVGEGSFTETQCGTRPYCAPELWCDDDGVRKYTRAVDIWSLGVVLYTCACGYQPFSDERFSQDFPFSMKEQIKEANYEYPKSEWDRYGDSLLDLIDRMLVVDYRARITIEGCLEHPWLTGKGPQSYQELEGMRFSQYERRRREVVARDQTQSLAHDRMELCDDEEA